MRFWALTLALGAAFAWQHHATIRDWIDPPPPIAANAERKVVLFATRWCGYCAKTRALFQRHNIPFQEYDIERSATAYAHYQRLGGNGVPLILIDTQVIHGYDEAAIRAALR